MKGTADFPRCGFSKAVVDVLNVSGLHFFQKNLLGHSHWVLGAPFTSVDVLQDDAVREGIKEFSYVLF